MGFFIHSFCHPHNKGSCISSPFQCLHRFLPFLLGRLGGLEEAPRGQAGGRWPDWRDASLLGHWSHSPWPSGQAGGGGPAELVPGRLSPSLSVCQASECPCNLTRAGALAPRHRLWWEEGRPEEDRANPIWPRKAISHQWGCSGGSHGAGLSVLSLCI